jgi:hypothetical protein
MGQEGAASNRARAKGANHGRGGINWSIINIVGPLLLAW